VQWSELQRDPKGVAALAANSTAEGAVSAARALRGIVAHLPATVAATALIDEFPWLDVLAPEDRAQFVADFVRAFQASAELGEWSMVAQTIREWQSTAAIHADPSLAGELARPLSEDFGPVPHPTEA
jgi:hypothetical protein